MHHATMLKTVQGILIPVSDPATIAGLLKIDALYVKNWQMGIQWRKLRPGLELPEGFGYEFAAFVTAA